MSSQRLMLAFAVLATLAVAAQCENAIFGYRRLGDSLAGTKLIREPAIVGRQVVAADSFTLVNGRRVTAVQVIDRSPYKLASVATVVAGGPGLSSVTVSFISNPGFGLDYEVRYFAL